MKEVFSFQSLATHNREKLKGSLPIETYRLLRISGMNEIFGESTGPVLYRLGKTLTSQFDIPGEEGFLALIERLGIGIPRIAERSDDRVVVNLFECMTCSGLPVTGELICNLECGFIAGGFEKITGRKTKGTQTKSWNTGDGFCQFVTELF